MGAGALASASVNIPIPSEEQKVIASSIPFPTKGVKLSYINEFYKLICGGKDQIKHLTTTEINDNYQKKITEKYKLSFCDYLSYLNHPAVGEATVFISHAWKYKFVDVIEALQFHFKNQPDIIIWFDLFSNNQHIAVYLDFDWWCGTFKSAIQKFNHTVMVLCPWNNPIPLTRGWCIWELYCTFVSQSKFAIALSATNQKEFLNDILSNGAADQINKMLSIIDAEESQCFKIEDKENIFKIVRKEVGFHNINSMIFEQMRDWVIATTKSFITNEKDDRKNIQIIIALGNLYKNQGKYDLAEPIYIDNFNKNRENLGNNSPLTLTSLNNLAVLYNNQGKYDLAEPLYVDCLKKQKGSLGDNHRHTLRTINNLAVLYKNQGKYDLAEPLLVDGFKKFKEIFGENHPETLSSMNNLALLYNNQGKYDLAEPLFVDCLKKREEILGDKHPDTLTSIYTLAGLYDNRGKYDLAEPLLVDCLRKRKEVLGSNHLDTQTSMNTLSLLYNNQRKYDLAEPRLVDCLKKKKGSLGDNHLDTLTALDRLITPITSQYDLAEPLYVGCFKRREKS